MRFSLDEFRAMLRENSKRGVLLNASVVFLIFFMLVSLFFFVYLPLTTHHGETITVPDLRGMTAQQAEEALDARQLRMEISDSSYSDQYKPSEILSQYPAPDAKVKKKRKVYIVINAATPPQVRIPDIIDGSLKNAVMLLRTLQIGIQDTVYQPHQFSNVVLGIKFKGKDLDKKTLAAGVMAAKGDKIVLLVGDGMGDSEVEVPNLTGMPLEEAETLLKGYNLHLGTVEKVASGGEEGSVIRQSPQSGQKIRAGDMVNVWVAEQ